ncbi:MAG: hypothetical protein M1837_003570 [Sclerophora amabilis]|nr:MAG: hypothetical protein M1837_003570 [Sclerophora amabilis]
MSDKVTSPATPSKASGAKAATTFSTDAATINTEMNENDSKFLLVCLKHTTGAVNVDTDAVAKALNYANHRSVGNRLTALKKKYHLAFTTSGKGGGNGADSIAGSAQIAPSKVRKTPSPYTQTTPAQVGKKRSAGPRAKRAKKVDDKESGDEIHSKTIKDEDIMSEGDKEHSEDLDEDAAKYNDTVKSGRGSSFPNLSPGEI